MTAAVTSSPRRNVHPFPAKMAPDVALSKIDDLTAPGAVILDPMCGSGTVPRLALQSARNAIGCDLDPLAVMMTRTACKPAWSRDLRQRAEAMVAAARNRPSTLPGWVADDAETIKFVNYWFAERQQRQLSQLARVLMDRPRSDDPLRVALSRLIVTKDGGASLARDTSHSRPHRVRLTNEFDVFDEFIASASNIARAVGMAGSVGSTASIRTNDARSLGFLSPKSVDLVLTSPPYLNAIDYLRGHRLSLVWLGWRLGELRDLRGDSIGAERGLAQASPGAQAIIAAAVPRYNDLRLRDQGMVRRFARDIERLCRSMSRVVKPEGHLVFVVADSQVRGVPVSNSAVCKAAAMRHGFEFAEGIQRPLPAQHRYLPPPDADSSTLSGRMKEESVLTFRRLNDQGLEKGQSS